MNLDEFRQHMEEFWHSVTREAEEYRYRYLAIERMEDLYGKFDSAERAMADQVLAEWALSEDEQKRYDALALIEHLKIVTAVPALRALAVRLSQSRALGADDELDIVNREIEALVDRGR
jgi:hypothetical protein